MVESQMKLIVEKIEGVKRDIANALSQRYSMGDYVDLSYQERVPKHGEKYYILDEISVAVAFLGKAARCLQSMFEEHLDEEDDD